MTDGVAAIGALAALTAILEAGLSLGHNSDHGEVEALLGSYMACAFPTLDEFDHENISRAYALATEACEAGLAQAERIPWRSAEPPTIGVRMGAAISGITAYIREWALDRGIAWRSVEWIKRRCCDRASQVYPRKAGHDE